MAVTRLAMAGPGADELERPALVRARWAGSSESMEGGRALTAAEALRLTLLDREYEALAGVTAAQVRGATALVPMPWLGWLTCEGEGPDLTADGLARAWAVTELRPVTAPSVAAPIPPAARRASGTREAGVLLTRLPGIDLLVRRKTGVPLINLGLYAPKLLADPPAQAGLGALLVRSALRGAGGLDPAALAYAFERLGGTLSPSAASDWLGFATSVLSEHLAEAAALLQLVRLAPSRGGSVRRSGGS
jgi:hypothetical protein